MQLDEVRFSDSNVIIFLDSVKILVFSVDFTGLHFIYFIGDASSASEADYTALQLEEVQF